MPVTTLATLSVPKNMLAERISDGPAVPKSSLAGRNSPVIVQCEQEDGSFVVKESVMTLPPPDITISNPLPPDASETMVKPEYEVNENGIGAAADAVDSRKIAPTAIVQTQPAQVFTPKKVPMSTSVTPPGTQNHHPTPIPEPKKVRVKMSNRGMGKVTVSVRAVSISESCVILAYPKDAENIVEPPVCDSTSPIKIEFDAKSYMCVFGGWTSELEDMFLVILLRDEDTEVAREKPQP